MSSCRKVSPRCNSIERNRSRRTSPCPAANQAPASVVPLPPTRTTSPPRPLTAPDRLGRPPLPLAISPTQTVLEAKRKQALNKLAPLATPPVSPLPTPGSELRLPSPLRRLLERQPLGHLGMLWSIRRSAPSPRGLSPGPELPGRAPWAAPCDFSSRPSEEKLARTQPAVRIGRRKRSSFDLGFSLAQHPVQEAQRGRSCNSRGFASTRAQAVASGDAQAKDSAEQIGARARCSSVPATGTAKADGVAVADAKARAVSLLKCYFGEEMAQAGPDADPNAAAARALRRLNEAPAAPSTVDTAEHTAEETLRASAHCLSSAAGRPPPAPPSPAAPSQALETDASPSPVPNRVRHPSPRPRVAVRG
mmetsp:Transcript_49748/g.96098  ORF Transcript_49748/g.96098 Transcript_49748/m.96098 type:complete len:363 (+) Transcript_49748:56-1144(+)